jgi:hypothetical protein
MSASDSPRGHAVHADGGLKDASEMEWTYDKDETVPFPSDFLTIPATDDSAVSSPLPSVRIHPFFTHAEPPAAVIAGSHRSTRTSRPSQRVREANNVQSLATGSTSAKLSTGTKRKAIVNLSPAPARRVVNKVVVVSDDGNETKPDGNDTEPAEDEDVNDADISSQSLQAMADADHEVRSLSFLS